MDKYAEEALVKLVGNESVLPTSLTTIIIIAVLAAMALGAGNRLPTGTWCNAAGNFTLIADGTNLAIWIPYGDYYGPQNGCRRLYAYGMDEGGNITLN